MPVTTPAAADTEDSLGHFLYWRKGARLLGTDHQRFLGGIRRPGLRAYAIDQRGLSYDSRAHFPLGESSFSASRFMRASAQLTIVLDGAFCVRRGGIEREVAAGWALPDAVRVFDERWMGERFRALVIEWDERNGDALELGTPFAPSAQDRARFSAFADMLLAGGARGGEAAHAMQGLQRALAAMGLPLRGFDSQFIGHPSPAQALLDGLSRSWTSFDMQPMWSDLSAWCGRSERQLRRDTDQLLRCWDTPGIDTLRARNRRFRTDLAISLLSAKNATVEQVASSVGYGSARALVTAFSQLGMATPSEIRQLLLAGR